jgi:ketosteroid isomerase-like protein
MGEQFKPWDPQTGKATATVTGKSDLAKIEWQFAADLRERGLQRAICDRAAENIRVHRLGMLPVVGKTTACKYLGTQDRKGDVKTVATFVSASDDLGYSYGYYKTNGDTPDGYYSRVWKKDNQGSWHIAVDTALPAQR